MDIKDKVAYLRKDIEYLKSTDFSSLLEVADDLVCPEKLDIPPATTGDIHKGEDAVDGSDV